MKLSLTLPNGFQGYFVNAAPTGSPTDGGKRLDKAALNIVSDPLRLDKAVTNGISCMGCHEQGIRDATDEVRSFVLDTNPPAPIQAALEALYPENTDKQGVPQLLSNDRKAFLNAMRNAGIADPTLGLTLAEINGSTDSTHVEMINALALKQDVDLTLKEAAAELGLTPDDFDKKSRTAGGLASQIFLALEHQQHVPRDRFEGNFSNLISQLNTSNSCVCNGLIAP